MRHGLRKPSAKISGHGAAPGPTPSQCALPANGLSAGSRTSCPPAASSSRRCAGSCRAATFAVLPVVVGIVAAAAVAHRCSRGSRRGRTRCRRRCDCRRSARSRARSATRGVNVSPSSLLSQRASIESSGLVGVGEVDLARRVEVRVERHAEQALLAAGAEIHERVDVGGDRRAHSSWRRGTSSRARPAPRRTSGCRWSGAGPASRGWRTSARRNAGRGRRRARTAAAAVATAATAIAARGGEHSSAAEPDRSPTPHHHTTLAGRTCALTCECAVVRRTRPRAPSTLSPPERCADATHAVENQPPPFEDVNLFDADRALGEGLAREGGGWAARARARLRGGDGQRRGARARARGEPPPARAHRVRPLRAPDRRGGVPSRVARADGARDGARGARAAVARAARGRARRRAPRCTRSSPRSRRATRARSR